MYCTSSVSNDASTVHGHAQLLTAVHNDLELGLQLSRAGRPNELIVTGVPVCGEDRGLYE